MSSQKLLHEREYFINLAVYSEEIIQKLTDKLRNKKKINSGDSFIIDIGEGKSIEIKFYKTYSRRAREYLKKQKVLHQVDALFFPTITEDADGTIEIYINNAKTYYYKDRDSIEIINNRLPKFLKDILRHEISHVHERYTADFANDKPDYGIDKDGNEKTLTADEYTNADEEVNAVFNQSVMAEIAENKLVQYYIAVGDVNGAVRSLVFKINSDPYIQAMSDKSKKWIIKTAYTTIAKIIEDRSVTP